MENYGIFAAILTFLAVFFTVFAVNLVLVDLFRKDRGERDEVEATVIRNMERQKARAAVIARRDLGVTTVTGSVPLDDEAEKTWHQKLRDLCNQSGLKITPAQIGLYGLATGTLCGGLVGLMFFSPLIGLGAFLVAIWFPLLFVMQKRTARANLLRSQLPDAFELMSRIMRSGQTITQAMNSVSEEFMPPVATEFGYCYEQQNLGLNPDLALRELAARTGIMELKIFVLALAVHRQAGGNLTELLDKLASVVRQRIRLFGDVKGLTAEGRMQAIVLMGLPVGVWLAMFFMNRAYALKLFEHPELIVGTLIAMVIGAVWINRIVNFDF